MVHLCVEAEKNMHKLSKFPLKKLHTMEMMQKNALYTSWERDLYRVQIMFQFQGELK